MNFDCKEAGVAATLPKAMDRPTHTPGPWRAEFHGTDASIEIWAGTTLIADVHSHVVGNCGQSDALLIGASPDMLAALIVARDFISTDRNSLADCCVDLEGGMSPDDAAAVADYDAALLQIDAAIKKAGAV
jgi:hypothetical protein